MAVFTPVSRAQLGRWLERFDLGALRAVEGIAAGIENSNFFVDTQRGRYVLTLFERLSAAELPFYLDLMHHLAAHGIPCPDPVRDRAGTSLGTLSGKPAALVTRLDGAGVEHPEPQHCAQVGAIARADARRGGRLRRACRSIPAACTGGPPRSPTSPRSSRPRRTSSRGRRTSATRASPLRPRSTRCRRARCTPTCFATTSCSMARSWAA